MIKIRNLFVIGLISLLAVILAINVSATYWEENPFNDVEIDDWYYDSVQFCKKNNLFAGTSENTFSPDTQMTRGMLVTVLASADGYNKSDYNRDSFNDVTADKWYYTAVCWAKENGIVAGYGTSFMPDAPITREQTVAILRSYSVYKNISDGKSSLKLNDIFSDYNNASDWAREPLSWAYENGIMTGTSPETISPKAILTRSSLSVMIRKLLSLNPKMTVSGVDISEYVIEIPSVYPANDVIEAAELLQKWISETAGVTLPIKNDKADSEYVISIGRTSHVDEKILDNLQETEFICNVTGNTLTICGKNDTNSVRGTLYGVYYFAEKELGYSFFADDLIKHNPYPLISLDDGYTYIDGPYLKNRIVYWQNGWDDVYLNDQYYNELYVVTPLGQLIYGDDYDYLGPTPCLSKQENLDRLINRIRFDLKKTDTRMIRLFPNDNLTYCTCDACMKAYREDGSRCAMLLRTSNYVSDVLTEEFPGLEIFNAAYTWAINPPKVTKCNDNVYVYFIAVTNCASHLYNDGTCTTNKLFIDNISGWADITKKVYAWDHSTDFDFSLCPFPDIMNMLYNTQIFCNYKTEGLFNNAIAEKSGEFGELRAYLLTRLYRKPYMSEDEYNYHFNRFLEAYYGPGWKNIRDFIDLLSEMKNSTDFTFFAVPDGIYDYEKVRSKADYINTLWDAAEKSASTEQEKEHVKRSRLSARFLLQCALFETEMTNGTSAQQEKYKAENDSLYNDIISMGVRWNEAVQNPEHFRNHTSPETWE